MARLFGQRAHVFVPSGVHPTAIAAIAAEGAQVTEITGRTTRWCGSRPRPRATPGLALVQDAGGPGDEQVPGWVVEGYSTLFAEVDMQLSEARGAEPALMVIPAGVGSLAQAGITHYAAGRDQAQPPADGGARHRRLRPGQPGPRRTEHHLDQRDDHGRANCGCSFHARLALPT